MDLCPKAVDKERNLLSYYILIEATLISPTSPWVQNKISSFQNLDKDY